MSKLVNRTPFAARLTAAIDPVATPLDVVPSLAAALKFGGDGSATVGNATTRPPDGPPLRRPSYVKRALRG